MMICLLRTLVIALVLLCSSAYANTSEGRNFAVAFAATRSDLAEGWCKININSKKPTDVTITTPSGTSTVSSDGNGTTTVEIPTSLRTISNRENKAIYIDALSEDISVMLSNYRSGDQVGEAMLAVPRNESVINEFHIMAYPSTNDIVQCVAGSTLSFYTVIPHENNTAFTVYQPSPGGGYTERRRVTLLLGQVYTERWVRDSQNNNFEITGFKVTSDNAVTVTGGNSCTDLQTDGNFGEGIIWATMPSISQAGTQFITHPISTGLGSQPYRVRVLSTQDNTRVIFRDSNVDETLDEGEFLTHELLAAFEDDVISCSNPCFVAEYGLDDMSAIFMSILPPTSMYNTDVKFSMAATENIGSTTLDHFINIILATNDPASSGISLDGNDISGSAWNVVADYSYITLQMTRGVEVSHTLTANTAFSVLAHAQMSNSSGRGAEGHGFIAAVAVDDSDSSPTTAPPGGVNPFYRIAMNGYFTTSDILDSACTVSYSSLLNTRSTEMVAKTNDLIGSVGICEGKSLGDIAIISASTIFLPSDASGTGETILGFPMRVNLDTMTVEEVTICGDEIGSYLLQHINWPGGDPLPDIGGCPTLAFLSDEFNATETDWICPVNNDAAVRAIPRYSLGHSGTFETADGSDIPTECYIPYAQDFQASTIVQALAVNNLIENNNLCSEGKDGNITILTPTSSLSTESTFQTYIFQATEDSSSDYLYSCVSEVSLYLQPHSNWPTPIISVPNCPEIVFPDEMFVEESKKWIC